MRAKKYTLIDSWRFRRQERSLFFWSFLAVLAGYLLVVVRKTGKIPFHWQEYLPLLVFICAMLTMHLILVLLKFRGDPLLLAAVFFLAGFGMLTQFRMGTFELIISDNLANYAFPAGLALMLIITVLFRRGRFRILQPLAIPCLLLAMALLWAIFFLGQRYRGALFLPGYINPADLIKILLMIFLAGFLARRQEQGGRAAINAASLVPLLVLWAVPMGLLLLQRDLGMLILLNAVLLVLLVMATGRISYLVFGMLFAVTAAAVIFVFSAHGQARFTAWLTPFADPTGKSWQILQALSAMYSGGLWGVGLGGGSPQFIPIASSDFIYAVIGEELGYAGCGIVLVFYLVLFFRGFQIAGRITALFGRLLATGIVTTLAFQTLLNIGGVVKALPLTGITLPFISHGGSSLLTSFLGVGLLLAVSERDTETKKISERPKNKRRPRRRVTADGDSKE